MMSDTKNIRPYRRSGYPQRPESYQIYLTTEFRKLEETIASLIEVIKKQEERLKQLETS
jgi:DNA-binding HxlR family transcriptional regulator